VQPGPSVAGLEDPKLEARRADSGSGILGKGIKFFPNQLGGLGERCKLPQWGLGETSAVRSFDAFYVLR